MQVRFSAGTSVFPVSMRTNRCFCAESADKAGQAYYDEEAKPLFEISNVDFIGEVSEKEKGPFLSGAIALIFFHLNQVVSNCRPVCDYITPAV